MAGINPLTVLYINFSLWSRRLLSNVSRLRLVSMVVTDRLSNHSRFKDIRGKIGVQTPGGSVELFCYTK